MTRIHAAAAGMAALLTFASPAGAADLGRRQQMPMKAPFAAPLYNWTGFYVGINGGGGWGHSSWDSPGVSTGDFSLSGGLVGGTFGYNYQVGQAVFGLETDIDWSNIKGSTNVNCPAGCETANNWLGTVRGRLGYAGWDRFMPYVTGGLAYGEVEANPAGLTGNSDTNIGWTLGGGLEFALASNWTAKVEYLYVDLGSVDCSLAACGGGAPSTDIDFRSNIVRGGLNYRF